MVLGNNLLKVLDPRVCVLGEGLAWNAQRNSVFWVDIDQKLVLEHPLRLHSDNDHCRAWSVRGKVTALLAPPGDASGIWMLTDDGLVYLDLISGAESQFGQFTVPHEFRTNDGNPAPDGRYWFGTMQQRPSETNGNVYSIGVDGDYREEFKNIGIPNTFASVPDSDFIYISDSLLQHTYRLNIESGKKERFLDFSAGLSTPDGGAIDSQGNLWMALWDGFVVKCFSPEGEELVSIELPVPRPTNCCFGGPNLKTLFITSAREGLDQDMLAKHPLSGSVFSIELDVSGAPLPSFGNV